MRLKLIITLILSFKVSAMEAMTPLQDLNVRLKTIKEMQADFIQVDMNDETVQSGKMAFKRPNKIYWHVESPFENIIISNGQKFWSYERELEQVIVSDSKAGMVSTPISYIFDEKELEKNFDVKFLDSEKEFVGYDLFPKDESNLSLQQIKLKFNKDNLVALSIVDALSVRSYYKFSNVDYNSKIKNNKFEFIPPDNVDIIGQE